MWGSCRSIVNGGEEKPPVVIGVNAVNEGSTWVSHCPVMTTVGEEPPIVEADKKLERGGVWDSHCLATRWVLESFKEERSG